MNIRSVNSLKKKGAAEVFMFEMENHWGTHIDFPRHFFEEGKNMGDYPVESFLFKSPHVVNVHLKPGELLCCGDWLETINPQADILLFQSGWGAHREKDIYSLENPGVHPDVGFFLREKYPNIRAIGIDWISISSYKKREIGRTAHKAFLDPEGCNEPILIIEDMDLRRDLSGLLSLGALPLRMDGVDSAPCTIVGGFND